VSARDLTLQSLCATRDALGALIVRRAPAGEPAAPPGQAASLEQLLAARDQVSAAINTVIGAAFRELPGPALSAAAKDLQASAGRLEAFSRSAAQVNDVLREVGQALVLVSRIAGLVV
jgi:hypothetical protein